MASFGELDDVVDFEEKSFQAGFADGTADGKKSGFHEDGIDTGFMKGYRCCR